MRKHTTEVVKQFDLASEFVNIVLNSKVLSVHEREHELVVLFNQFVTVDHNHKLYKTLVNQIISALLFNPVINREGYVAGEH